MANILVIDDDHAVLATIELVLARDAHTVVVTDDGRKGLEMFKTGAFDLLVVDIFMPAMDGLQTMGLARRYRPEVPVLVISGNALRSALRAGLPAHGDQTWSRLEPAETVPAQRSADRSRQLPGRTDRPAAPTRGDRK